MYTRILVPLDGSRAAEAALPVAVGLAQRSGAMLELGLIHVSVGAVLAGDATMLDFAALDDVQREEESSYLLGVTDRLRAESGLTVSAQHLSGPVVPTLVAHIANAKVDLVVMTTHGRGSVGRFWLGSVADGLVRTASAPVLMLRASDRVSEEPAGFNRVLIPLDQSPLAEHALLAARDLVGDDGECILLHVMHPGPMMAVMPVPFGLIPELVVDPASHDRAQGYLERAARRMRRMGLSVRTAVTIAGNAAVEILDQARRDRADAIVVTTHGRGGLRRVFLGSVVDKLVRGADVPVLVCRPPARRRATTARRAVAVHSVG